MHSELIARAGEMIATYYKDQHENGLQRLKKQAPKLLDYYLKVFLPDVENHIEKLLQRATRGWPLLEKKPDADIQFKR